VLIVGVAFCHRGKKHNRGPLKLSYDTPNRQVLYFPDVYRYFLYPLATHHIWYGLAVGTPFAPFAVPLWGFEQVVGQRVRSIVFSL